MGRLAFSELWTAEENGVVTVNSNMQTKVRLLSAAIGVSALVGAAAMGIIVAGQAGTGAHSDTRLVATPTTTTPPSTPTTTFATPADTATPPPGFR
jgi:hypothetical protein